ncbi:MAG: SIS domain-containing protein [Bacteroidia bacterium]|nr:SIS domain-containing protein [Bacteroidia bacterium]
MNPKIRHILEAEAAAILNIPTDNDFEKVVDVLFRYVHQEHGKVITSGLGKAGQVALNLASTLSATGTPSVFLHPSEAQHGDLGMLHHHDPIILVSNSGKTRELLELITLTRNLHGENPIIVITGNKESPLAQAADVTLFTGGPEEICPLNLTPTTSITVMLVIGHILTTMLIEKTGFTREGFFKRHHGGYLGSLLKNDSL